jgi:hypothetical protein
MVGDVFVSGDLSATTVSATTYYGDGSNLTGISTQDTFVTGGTYSDGTAVFTNNTGGTFNVSGFYTGATDVFVTGGTYLTSASTLTFTNNTGGTFNITGITTSSEFTGGTVTGATSFSGGLTATTISATTYQNLPVTADTFVTGFTYDSINTFTIKQNEGQSDLTATINDLSLNSLSATTITSGGTLLQTIIQNIVTSSSPVYIRRHDFTGDTITSTSYCGTAPDGSLENQPFWDITKINIPLIGSGTTSTYASGVTWTGRYTHIYT